MGFEGLEEGEEEWECVGGGGGGEEEEVVMGLIGMGGWLVDGGELVYG